MGRDTLRKIGLSTNFEDNVMTWDDITVPMKPYPQMERAETRTAAEALLSELLEADLEDGMHQDFDFELYQVQEDSPQELGYHSKTILESKYEEVDIKEVVAKCTHLSLDQRNELEETLSQYTTLFDGTLGVYHGEKIHLDIDPTIPPARSRHYPVPHHQLKVFKQELDRLEKIGVLKKTGRAEWISGTFITPKKDGRVRWVSDFRALNKALKRKVYPLPRINDLLKRRSGYKYLTKLDISMQYYTFELDEESSQLCTIATPFGLYRYQRLPMGVTVAPDIAQEIMETVLDGIEGIEVYIDDIAIFSNSWQEHQKVLKEVLSRLQDAGFTINPLKCEWAVQETDFLGHWLTPQGVKPWQKKVDAIVKMQPPTDTKQLRAFLGLVTYYRDMWPRRSHILTPLTNLTGKKKFEWTKECQRAFEEMKALAATDALLAYPDHNLPFDVETDASDYQLGAVIKQQGRPVAYYSRKLNAAQRNYTTIEKELLSIVETLKEFRTMLLGAKVHVYTDHQNLTHQLTSFTTQRVLRWRLLLEEYGCTYHYKKGPANLVADALSRVPTARMSRGDDNSKQLIPLKPETTGDAGEDDVPGNDVPSVEVARSAEVVRALDERQPELAQCLLVYPKFDDQNRIPFKFETIQQYQAESPGLQLAVQQQQYQLLPFGSVHLICRPTDGKIVLTDSLLTRVVRWYHLSSVHIQGMDRLYGTISRHFYHPRLREEVRAQVSTCTICQQNKRYGRQYGELAPRDAFILPWQEVHVDMIGPWKIRVNGRTLTIKALTAIDPSTALLEIARAKHPTTAREAFRVFENTWLSRYPRPLRCVHDNGPEFQGHDFQFGLHYAGIKSKPTTSANPESNGIIESVHRSIGVALRTLIQAANPTSQEQVDHLIEHALATAMHATRCAAHSSLQQLTPGGLVFRRDMYLDIPLIADILTLQTIRQQGIDQRLLKANAQRLHHEFKVNDQVLKRNEVTTSDKLRPTFSGPHRILQVHTNGTVTIQINNHIRERINIRRLQPFRS